MILATDEVFTYVIFNYVDMQWTSHTESGGDTTGGEGGVPAFVSHTNIVFSISVNVICAVFCAVGGIQRGQRDSKFRVLPVFAEIDH